MKTEPRKIVGTEEYVALRNEWYTKRQAIMERDALRLSLREQKVAAAIEKKLARLAAKSIKPKKRKPARGRGAWKEYGKMTWKHTNSQNLSILEHYEKRGFYAYHLDHIVSVWDGYKHGLPYEWIGDISNLRFIPQAENNLKGIRSVPESLVRMLRRSRV